MKIRPNKELYKNITLNHRRTANRKRFCFSDVYRSFILWFFDKKTCSFMFSDEFGKLRQWGCNALEHRFFLYRRFYPRRNRKYWWYWQGQWCRLVAPSSTIRLPNNKFTLLPTSTWVLDLDFGACTAVPCIPFFSSWKLRIKVHAINSCYFRAPLNQPTPHLQSHLTHNRLDGCRRIDKFHAIRR